MMSKIRKYLNHFDCIDIFMYWLFGLFFILAGIMVVTVVILTKGFPLLILAFLIIPPYIICKLKD